MSLLNKPEEKIVLASRMEGRITFDGKPVVGAKIERLIKWKDDVGEKDYTETDKEGFFFFPKIEVKAKISKISQFVATQDLTVNYNQKNYIIWTVSKMSKNEYGELNGKPVNFRCELTDEDTPIRLDDSYIMTNCKWDTIKPIKG